MNRRLLASLVGVGVVGLAPWVHAQTPKPAVSAPPSSAAFAPAPAAAPPPAVTPPAAAPPAAPPPGAAPPAAPGPEVSAAAEPLPPAPAAPEPAAAAPAPAPAPARSSLPPLSDASSAETPPDQEAPSSGLALIIVGWVATGVGAGNLALIPTCYFNTIESESQQLVRDVCVGIHVGFGVVGLGIGIPFLAVGYNKRSKYNEWKEHHAVLDHLLHTEVAVENNGAMLLYRGSF